MVARLAGSSRMRLKEDDSLTSRSAGSSSTDGWADMTTTGSAMSSWWPISTCNSFSNCLAVNQYGEVIARTRRPISTARRRLGRSAFTTSPATSLRCDIRSWPVSTVRCRNIRGSAHSGPVCHRSRTVNTIQTMANGAHTTSDLQSYAQRTLAIAADHNPFLESPLNINQVPGPDLRLDHAIVHYVGRCLP